MKILLFDNNSETEGSLSVEIMLAGVGKMLNHTQNQGSSLSITWKIEREVKENDP